jgi:hypothetical protein
MKLSIKTAQDVEAFGNQITEVSRWIEGTGLAPNDLSVLMARAFLERDVLTFSFRALALHNKVDDEPSSQMADQIVRTLWQKYRSLLSQGLGLLQKVYRGTFMPKSLYSKQLATSSSRAIKNAKIAEMAKMEDDWQETYQR